MIRISITAAAFEAISATLLLGTVGFEPAIERNSKQNAGKTIRPNSPDFALPKNRRSLRSRDCEFAIEMSEQPEEKPTWVGSLDKAVFGLCGLLGLVFALPFAQTIYHGAPISRSQIGFLVLGVAWAAVGPMWPMIRAKVAAPAAASLETAARDARTWIAVMLFAFGYFFFRTPVPPPPPSASQITAAVAAKFPTCAVG